MNVAYFAIGTSRAVGPIAAFAVAFARRPSNCSTGRAETLEPLMSQISIPARVF
jgi:hypothetical protein